MLACSVSEMPAGRVLLIGIDGAAPRVINDLLAEGRLPNLARLAREGASGTLRSSMPISSPRIWNTIVTGKVPDQHGILHFSKQDEDGVHHLFLSTDRKARALWSIVSQRGGSAGVVNFWNTYPPEKLNGVMVSDHLLATEIAGRELIVNADPTPPGSVIYPADWHARLTPLVADQTQFTHVPNPFSQENVLPGTAKRNDLSRHFHEDSALVRITLEIEREIRPDVMMVLLPGIDRVSHFLWGTLEPAEKYPEPLRPNPRERAGGKAALLSYYEYTDALIGKLIAGSGKRDLVIVVSDHGFEAGQAFMVLTGIHESEAAINGVVFARGPGITPTSKIVGLTVNDITPTILAWMGLAVADDMDGSIGTFLDVASTGRVASYEIGEIEFVDSHSSGVETEIVEQLRTLGYLEESKALAP